MSANLPPFNTGDTILDEMMENKRAACAEHGFDLHRIAAAMQAEELSHPERHVDLTAETERKFQSNELPCSFLPPPVGNMLPFNTGDSCLDEMLEIKRACSTGDDTLLELFYAREEAADQAR